MQLEASVFLHLCQQTGDLIFFDIESTNLKGDYGAIICVSFKPFGQKPFTIVAEGPGNDRKLCRQVKQILENHWCWCSYYGTGFDIKMINTRLIRWGMRPVEKRPHLDLWKIVRFQMNTARKSQAHVLGWLGTPEQKMSVSANDWATIASNWDGRAMRTMIRRCESDTIGLEALYKKIKNLVVNVTR